ncbi:MAG: methyltransferase domain-containing protein [Victivallales bacterium]|nr:methyltransferase domain-containing protein [Victivallales bacterium]
MNTAKADFFDKAINSPWANDEYTERELQKINKFLNLCKVSAGSKIIEPGCGAGRLTEILASECGETGEIIAFDISSEMVKLATKRTKNYKNVKIYCSSAENYKYTPNYFDAVICHQAYPHFDNTEKATASLSKALKPGGRFIISHLIGISEINDVHRKSDTPVQNDIMPETNLIKKYFAKAGMAVNYIVDNEDMFIILAIKN